MKKEDYDPIEDTCEIAPSSPVPGSEKWISSEQIEFAAARAGLPKKVKHIGPYTVDIYQAVGELKKLRNLKLYGYNPWGRLRSILSNAIDEGMIFWRLTI
jgi:hypothetical protein